MLIIIYLVLTGIYLAGTGYLFFHFTSIKEWHPARAGKTPELMISVVVVVRDEERNIKELLNDFSCQSLEAEYFEVLVINDHSSDRSSSLITEMATHVPYLLRLLHLGTETGKKAGLEMGINNAAGKIIAVTDGDCRVPTDWLLTLLTAFREGKAVFTSGPVTYTGESSFFEKLQTIEFASLVGSGASLLHAGHPGMCNAANMAFLKEAFREVNGFTENKHIPSGDDEFLLQAVYFRYPGRVFYLKSKKAIVKTKAQPGPLAFFYQRKRWAGKWRLHKNIMVALTAVGLFVFYACWLFLFLAIMIKQPWTGGGTGQQSLAPGPLIYFFGATLLKFGAELLFLQIIMRSLGKKLLLLPFLTLQLLYPVYVLFFGVAVNFGSFSWKGRTYKYTNT